VARLAGDRLDLHDALCDLGHLQLEELAEQVRVRARHQDRGALGRLSNLHDVGLQPLPVPVRLGGDLFGLRKQRLDLAQVEHGIAPGVLLDDPGHDVALAAGELLIRHLLFGIPELLVHDLLGGSGRRSGR